MGDEAAMDDFVRDGRPWNRALRSGESTGQQGPMDLSACYARAA